MAARSRWIFEVNSSSPFMVSKWRRLWINNIPDLQPLRGPRASGGVNPVICVRIWKPAHPPPRPGPTKKWREGKTNKSQGWGGEGWNRRRMGGEGRIADSESSSSSAVPGCIVLPSCKRGLGLYFFCQDQLGFVGTHCWLFALLSAQGKLKLLAVTSAWIATRLRSEVPDLFLPAQPRALRALARLGTSERFSSRTAAAGLGILLSYFVLSHFIALPDSK